MSKIKILKFFLRFHRKILYAILKIRGGKNEKENFKNYFMYGDVIYYF